MRRILEITRKDLYNTFTDRNLLLLMFAAPLALATIIAVTFGGVAGNSAPIQNIPVAIVNLDEGIDGQNFGQVIADLLVRPEDYDPETGENTLHNLINGYTVASAEEAREKVELIEANAAIIIPADFSANLSPRRDLSIMTDRPLNGTTIELYTNPNFSLSASITESVLQSIAAQIAAGNVAAASIIQALIESGQFTQIASVTSSDAFTEGLAQSGQANAVTVERQSVAGERVSFNPLVLFGASQAIFFALFTANGAATNVLEEQRNYTLQRLLMTPTPRIHILLGKMIGTFVMVLLQLVFLFIAFTIVASLLSGQFEFIWGTNVVMLLVVTFVASLATTGLGAIVAAGARTPDQASTLGSILAMAMAVLGGSFGFQLGAPMQYFSIVYWGTDAYTKLAQGSGDYLFNIVILLGIGAVTFGIATLLFFRRIRSWS